MGGRRDHTKLATRIVTVMATAGLLIFGVLLAGAIAVDYLGKDAAANVTAIHPNAGGDSRRGRVDVHYEFVDNGHRVTGVFDASRAEADLLNIGDAIPVRYSPAATWLSKPVRHVSGIKTGIVAGIFCVCLVALVASVRLGRRSGSSAIGSSK